MDLNGRISALATRIANYLRDNIVPRLLPSGGATGQILVKNSAVNYNAGWQTISNNTFIQPTAPDVPAGTPYIWWQTGLGPGGTDMTMWVEDGQ